MSKEYSERLRQVGLVVKAELPQTDFCLMVFSHDKPGFSNYVHNVENKEVVLAALKELVNKLENE